MTFKKAGWIWLDSAVSCDEHAEFIDTLVKKDNETYTLAISCDTDYSLFINEELAEFGQYADYPHYKVYDSVDITKHLSDGENRIKIIVWYSGAETSTHVTGTPLLIYEVTDSNDCPVIWSSEDTLSRLSPEYLQHQNILISSQLGLSFGKRVGFSGEDAFKKSRIIPGTALPGHIRPVKKLKLLDRAEARVCSQGAFKYTCSRGTGIDMQHADLSFMFIQMLDGRCPFNPRFPRVDPIHMKNSLEESEGIYFLIDLENETSGFIEFEIELQEDARVDIGWGEHLSDGRCRTAAINFSCTFDVAKGRHMCTDTFRRVGCRYIQFFIHSKEAIIYYAGMRPTVYPLTVKKPDSGNLLRDTIYEVCENTLINCMHEHYEDCPSREQAMYTLDSRNQMLCGYYCFNEREFARASLRLIAEGMGNDKLLDLCFPATIKPTIPSYTLAYYIQMSEYIEHTHDITLAEEVYDKLCVMLNNFTDNLCPNGLFRNLPSSDRIWNFYEWQPTLMGEDDGRYVKAGFDAPLNAYLSLALKSMSFISRALWKEDDAAYYSEIREKLNHALLSYFYDEEKGLFFTREGDDRERYSVFTNAICCLALEGKLPGGNNVLKIVAADGDCGLGFDVIPSTLSMLSFRYDALLLCDRKGYRDMILDEIDRNYLHMLRNNATSFWETILGDNDIIGVCGSLCHGWSALPVYYYEKLCDRI